MKIFTLDVEASSLSNESYPIQVGFTEVVNGKHATTEILIKRDSDWIDWDEETELYIHNISRDDLEDRGESIHAICKILNEKFSGQIVIVDSKDYDDFWINKLHEAANIPKTYVLIHIDKYLKENFGVDEGAYEDERCEYTISHQAGEDSVVIMQILNSLINKSPA